MPAILTALCCCSSNRRYSDECSYSGNPVCPGSTSLRDPVCTTMYTATIETVDNDVLGRDLLSLEDPPRPTPGTFMTVTTETVDNDAVAGFAYALSADLPPRPGTDEDDAGSLTSLL